MDMSPPDDKRLEAYARLFGEAMVRSRDDAMWRTTHPAPYMKPRLGILKRLRRSVLSLSCELLARLSKKGSPS